MLLCGKMLLSIHGAINTCKLHFTAIVKLLKSREFGAKATIKTRTRTELGPSLA